MKNMRTNGRENNNQMTLFAPHERPGPVQRGPGGPAPAGGGGNHKICQAQTQYFT